MPNPTIGDRHIDAALTDVSVAFFQEAQNFIARRVFPVVGVSKRSDRYFVYNKGDLFRDEAELRTPGTPSARATFRLSNDPYFAEEYSLHHDIDDTERANADPAINPDSDATDDISQKFLIKQDKIWATKFFTTGIWGSTDQTGVVAAPGANQFLQWNDASSVPLTDLARFMDTVELNSGFRPNKLVLGADVWTQLQNNPQVLGRISPSQLGITTPEIFAALVGSDRPLEVIVARGVENTAAEGLTPTLARLVDPKAALLVWAAPSAGLKTPSGGYTFSFTEFDRAAGGAMMRRFRMDEIRSDRIEGSIYFDMKVVAADVGIFMDQAVA